MFLATILFVTFAKIHWELAADLSLADVLTAGFLIAFLWDRFERGDGRLTRTSIVALAFFAAFLVVYLVGFFNLDTEQALTQWTKGMVKFVLHFGFLVAGVTLLARRSQRFYWYALAALCGGIALNAVYGIVQLLAAELGIGNLDALLIEPITGRDTSINIFGAVDGRSVFRPNGLTGDPNHLGIELVIPLLVLTPIYLRLEAGHRLKTPLAAFLAFCLLVELATLSRSGLLGLACGALILAIPYRRYLKRRELLVPLGAVLFVIAAIVVVRWDFFDRVITARTQTSRAAASPHFLVYEFIPDVLSTNPFFGLGLNNFAVYYEFVTGRPDFGPHSFYVATIVETGIVGTALFAVFVLWVLPPSWCCPEARSRAPRGRRPARRACAAARVGDDRRARRDARRERLLPDDDLLLLLRLRGARGRGAGRLRATRSARARLMRVLVLTTSYPRTPEDVAGVFVRDAVEHLRAAGIEVEVVSPASFRHFGLAYGHGIPGNIRRRPWLALLLPLFLLSYARAARSAARGADIVHAHWLPSSIAALATGKPFVLQLWGTDAELALRAPALFRPLVRRARIVICASNALAEDARRLGAREVRVVPSGVDIPAEVAEPDDPPHVLYVGRLSEEKGIPELLEATEGLPRVIVGDGPLRDLVPDAVGFVPPSELGPFYERAAVVVCPSRREGYGVVAREAMAYGRPIVASAVGGLLDAVEDGVTGVLVTPGDREALRRAVTRFLDDSDLRRELGAAARERARERFTWRASTEATVATYRAALAVGAR